MNAHAYPDDNPKTARGAVKPPLHFVPPVALLHLGAAMENGGDKYGAMNWREKRISSSVYYDAAMRHLLAWWDGEDVAPDSGVHHLGHVMACMALILDGSASGMLNDNRPTPGMFADAARADEKRRKAAGVADPTPEDLKDFRRRMDDALRACRFDMPTPKFSGGTCNADPGDEPKFKVGDRVRGRLTRTGAIVTEVEFDGRLRGVLRDDEKKPRTVYAGVYYDPAPPVEFEVGDRVEYVEGLGRVGESTVTEVGSAGVRVEAGPYRIPTGPNRLIRRLNLKVGDRVKTPFSDAPGTVRVVDDRGVNVLWDGCAPSPTVRWQESHLERVR